MAEENKKISFGFAKSIKKPVLKKVVPQEEKKVDYIKSVGEEGIKIIGEQKKEENILIVPLPQTGSWHDKLINRVKSEHKVKEEVSETSNGHVPQDNKDISKVKIKTEPSDDVEEPSVNLDEQAAKEIIEELKSGKNKSEEESMLTLPVPQGQYKGEEEATLEDYEQIPVRDFGLAMLRGMGWQPGRGIGKNPKVVNLIEADIRPKWMGLGGTKAAQQKQAANSKNEQEEELKLQTNAFIKITSGKYKNCYGQVESISDNPGWLTIKLALGGIIISANELMVQPVTKSEYSEHSKILNASKYEEYKNREAKQIKGEVNSESSEPEDCSKKKKDVGRKKDTSSSKHEEVVSRETSKKKSKRHKKYLSDTDTDAERRHRKRSNSSSSDDHSKIKTKKHKKHSRRDSSPEYTSRKHKRKDKERERTKDRKMRDRSRSPDRRKHRKR